mmetsp:Transcript_7688/g.20968  ORF Transcript_7688/g.20968 Transcript_7688/m.20968 type:complete len:267 (-) Transcript_7688:58-858(-)
MISAGYPLEDGREEQRLQLFPVRKTPMSAGCCGLLKGIRTSSSVLVVRAVSEHCKQIIGAEAFVDLVALVEIHHPRRVVQGPHYVMLQGCHAKGPSVRRALGQGAVLVHAAHYHLVEDQGNWDDAEGSTHQGRKRREKHRAPISRKSVTRNYHHRFAGTHQNPFRGGEHHRFHHALLLGELLHFLFHLTEEGKALHCGPEGVVCIVRLLANLFANWLKELHHGLVSYLRLWQLEVYVKRVILLVKCKSPRSGGGGSASREWSELSG